MRVGQHTKYVTLARSPQTSGDSDGYYEDLVPPDWWCNIEPQGGTGEGRTVEHVIRGRFHPQITTDTRIVYSDGERGVDRHFFVRSFINVGERNVEMQSLCEEVIP